MIRINHLMVQLENWEEACDNPQFNPDPIWIYPIGSLMFLMDGHHRLAYAIHCNGPRILAAESCEPVPNVHEINPYVSSYLDIGSYIVVTLPWPLEIRMREFNERNENLLGQPSPMRN